MVIVPSFTSPSMTDLNPPLSLFLKLSFTAPVFVVVEIARVVGVDRLECAVVELLQPIRDVLKLSNKVIKTSQCFRAVLFVPKIEITPLLCVLAF